ncbi:MAG: hypothetical protein IT311_02115 [Anaerolineales bacterium]|nr:hypothetical protein [Anaerolineales bacterium]
MNYRSMFAVNAVALALFGAGFLLLPKFVWEQLRYDETVGLNFLARFFGSALLLLGILLWMVKDVASAKLQRAIAMVLFGYSIGGFALTIMGTTNKAVGVVRANGWVLLVIYAAFALIYGYMLFLQPKEQQRAPKKTSSKSGSTPPAGMG